MKLIHWQGETIAKVEPYTGSIPTMRPGRTPEIAEDNDPRVIGWEAEQVAERATREAAEAEAEAVRQSLTAAKALVQGALEAEHPEITGEVAAAVLLIASAGAERLGA